MSLILNIDTAGATANVFIAKSGTVIESKTNHVQKDHAAFLHPAISGMLRSGGIHMHELDAIAVTSGPGSYTGIRVGMASAKGLCTALRKPLITLNTLEIMAKDVITHYQADDPALFCPMVDARRMEVYTALYDRTLKEELKPCAIVLDNNSYSGFAAAYSIIYFGSGSDKWKNVVKLRNSIFMQNVNIPQAMATMSFVAYMAGSFTDVAYSEPMYLKEFFNGT